VMCLCAKSSAQPGVCAETLALPRPSAALVGRDFGVDAPELIAQRRSFLVAPVSQGALHRHHKPQQHVVRHLVNNVLVEGACVFEALLLW